MYIVEKILDKCENSSVDWQKGCKGNRTIKVLQSDYDKCGKTTFIEEAKLLEQKKLINIKWLTRGSDISEIKFSLENLEKIYKLSPERKPKCAYIENLKNSVEENLKDIKTEWIKDYYKDILKRLEPGSKLKIPENEEKYFNVFKGLDELNEPMYRRLFSIKYMNDSKDFENNAEDHVVAVAKKFNSDLNSEMNRSEVLSILNIEEYSQELSLKGPLVISTYKDGKEELHNLISFKYGTVLNTETLKNSTISVKQPELKTIIMIENKANFVMAPYKEDTLYIFTHGYFSPTEIKFLKQLKNTENYEKLEIYHSSDLDYGGVKIFEYIENNLFEKVMPYMMDVDIYEKYISYGEVIEETTLNKLKKTNVQKLQKLVDKILEYKLGIEQESFLIEETEE